MPGIAGECCLHDEMLGKAGLNDDPAWKSRNPRASRADETTRARQQRERLLRAAEPVRSELLVEVEPDNERGRAHPVQHRLGADEQTGPRHLHGRRGDLGRRLTYER